MKQSISDDKLDRFVKARLELRYIAADNTDDFALELATNLQNARRTNRDLAERVRVLEGETDLRR